ncbi:MAG: sulfate permease [Gammaproteobacteria bacterium]|nr:sulfate permease [Gammaproteobacteria bacterium]
MESLRRYLPILDWGRRYNSNTFANDGVAAIIVAIMLIPQSLAYALLAGLPAEAGLYASIFALTLYGLFGTSTSLSVGPVAVISLMTAAAIGKLALTNPADYLAAALTLAFLSGAMLLILGLLRLGFLANFLSHPVIAAFITASAIIIAAGQVQHILGISAGGHNLLDIVLALSREITHANAYTVFIGFLAIAMIIWVRIGLKPLLLKVGVPPGVASLVVKAGPVLAVVVTALLTFLFRLDQQGVELVGDIPRGMPGLTMPDFSRELISSLFGSAVLISIISFVESISVSQTLAARRRQRIDPDQELIGLGLSNMAVSFGGGFPVTGGFSRSIVNYDAGAATPAAGIFTAILMGMVALFLTPLIFWLPKATLAATIIVAVFSLIDFSLFKQAWNFSRTDFFAMFTTISLTLIIGVEVGIGAGVLSSILMTLYKTSKPHVAIVGRVPNTEHYRNIKRHKVQTFENLLSIRIDESLYFANTRYLEELIYKMVAEYPKVRHVILMCTAVNKVDLSALETLTQINETLSDLGIQLHVSEVKGPMMDKLQRTDFFSRLSGNCYLSHNQAVEDLKEDFMPLSGL